MIAKKFFRPDLGKLVQTRSAVIAATDNPYKDPNWILCVWLVLDGKLDFEQFRVNFYNNIVLKKIRNGQLHSPEYQQYFSKWLGFMFWKWEEKFDIKDHMRYIFPDDIDATINEEDLRQLIKQLAWKPFQDKKSPWEFLFVPNYKENGKDYPDKSVLFLRVHHGFCDGFAILNLLLKEVNNISMANVAKPARIQKNFLIKSLETVLFWLMCPYMFMKMLVRTVDTNEWHLPSQKLIRPLNTGFTDRIPLSYIKEIKNIHNVSFSAVIYASLTGALRNMMLEMGKKVPSYMSTAVAVPMPGHPEKLRNHFIFSFLQLPIGIENPIDCLQKVERNLTRLKRSPVPLFNFGLIPLLGGTFASTMKLFSANKYSTLLTSNFPGPPATTYFIGGGGSNRVTDMNFAAGLGEGDVGIGFCMMSYDEGMRIITSFDTNILSSDQMVDLFNKKIIEQMEIFRLNRNCV
ncbi:unnamed protein product [Orchesella dallaii]|uniref:O-acyltransferase WSD1 C-terminal domain-containing protein n=1 Tax=Orchesella dallaii TaxID=48710 RepID=A0ABP1QBP4_9HEXA